MHCELREIFDHCVWTTAIGHVLMPVTVNKNPEYDSARYNSMILQRKKIKKVLGRTLKEFWLELQLSMLCRSSMSYTYRTSEIYVDLSFVGT